MGVGPRRGMLTAATGMRALSRYGPALAVLVVLAAAALAVGPAASRTVDGVPSSADCRRLLARAPIPATRPAAPSRMTLLDAVGEFVESSPDGQRYVFPTADERARFQCGFQYAAGRQLRNAERLLQPLQYDVKQLVDTGAPTERRLIVLEERKSRGRDGVLR